MDAEYWEIALIQALQQLENESNEEKNKRKRDKHGDFKLLSNEYIIQCDLETCAESPLMKINGDSKRRKVGVVDKKAIDQTRRRKVGVSERNETERKVVYRTLRNFIKMNKLKNYNMF